VSEFAPSHQQVVPGSDGHRNLASSLALVLGVNHIIGDTPAALIFEVKALAIPGGMSPAQGARLRHRQVLEHSITAHAGNHHQTLIGLQGTEEPFDPIATIHIQNAQRVGPLQRLVFQQL